jgi:Flp pilus assembly protein TadD
LLRARGVVALTRGEDRLALAAFRDLAVARPDSAEAAYLLAEAEARAGDADAARYQLMEAWRRDAEHPLAPPVVARVFAADTDERTRRRLIGDLQRKAPDSALIEPLQAQTLLDAGHPEQAAELYAAMLARDPDNQRLFARLVHTLVAAGQREPVIDLALPWMEKHPDDIVIALALADVHADLGRAAGAVRWYRRVLELAPDNLFALNDLAVLLTETQPREALQLAERAYDLAPDEPQVLDTYGTALLATGATRRARELLTKAYGYRRSDPGIGLNLARALAADGDAEAARRLLGPLLEEPFPRQVEARALLQRLSLQ